MSKRTRAKNEKKPFHNRSQGEHKLAFAFNADRTKWYYRTKSGAWCNISEMNPYGLRYILDRLEKEGRRSSKIYEVVNEELETRLHEIAMRRSA